MFYPPRKFRGSAILAVVVVLAVVSGILSLSTAKISQAAMNGTTSNKISSEAHSIAQSDADLLRATAYANLSATARQVATGTAYEHEVVLSNESKYTDDIKQRTATINVYKGKESLPRASLVLKRYSTEKESSGVPVGTVIAWPGAKAPTTNGVWLECNGQSCAKYPALVAVLGKNTVPDYRNRFLESAITAGTVKDAGLPNITATMDNYKETGFIEGLSYADYITCTGAFYLINLSASGNTTPSDDPQLGNSMLRAWGFDASRSNKIYGKSTTVQPASVTVRRFIKAA